MAWIRLLVGAVALGSSAVLVAFTLSRQEVRQLNQKIDSLESERTELIEYARRLSASRRVAQIDVLHQRGGADGRVVTTLVWQEIGPSGILGKPVALEVFGQQVYFEALVIKFEPGLIGGGDPERGASLAMFHRIFGEQQAPESAPQLDRLSRPPLEDPRTSHPLHDKLWGMFWELVDRPDQAAQLGVRVAQCEAPAVRVKENEVWELRLDALGSLNLRKIGVRAAPESDVGASGGADQATIAVP